MKRLVLVLGLLALLLLIPGGSASAWRRGGGAFVRSGRLHQGHRVHHFRHFPYPSHFFFFGLGAPLLYGYPAYYSTPLYESSSAPPPVYAPPLGYSSSSPAGSWEWRCDPPGSFCQLFWVPAY